MTSITETRKVLFVINSLEGGGAERMISIIASALAEVQEKWVVALTTLDQCEDKYPLSPRVARIRLDPGGQLISRVHAFLRLMRRERPDVIVSFLTRANCAAIACSRLLTVPCVISERVHTTSHFSSSRHGNLQRLIVRYLYPRADHVIAVSKGVEGDLVRNYGVPQSRVTTVYNPIEADAIARAAQLEPSISLPKDYAVAVGRLVVNKNFSLLLRSFARSNIGGSLVILGEGPERANLAALASKLGIAERVLMPGFVDNPYAVIRRARVYASSSNAEGFPNAMLEAMCLGTPVIATDCDTGPAEILQGYSNRPRDCGPIQAAFGLLVPPNDEQAMSTAFYIMADAETRVRYGLLAMQRATDFRLEHVITQYQSIISGAIGLRASSERTAGGA